MNTQEHIQTKFQREKKPEVIDDGIILIAWTTVWISSSQNSNGTKVDNKMSSFNNMKIHSLINTVFLEVLVSKYGE